MESKKPIRLGIDIGSTTIKVALLDEDDHLIFSDYKRHFANIKQTLQGLISDAEARVGDIEVCPMITGSGGLALAKHLGIPFNQEVIAVSTALASYAPKTDVAIELGGEDAKIIYFEGGSVEQRMNGICAGGTGSFIDQMASLIQTDAAGLNEYAGGYKEIYPIAARCGVFAKTDIQPLINEGATREDLSASIFQAVVNQTISGLACGKPIRGHVAFLGGPLHFLDQLRAAFIRTLGLDDEHTITPENSHLFAAMGSALNCDESVRMKLGSLTSNLSSELHLDFEVARLEPLFTDQKDYDEFEARHAGACVKKGDLASYRGNAFLGIDAGSTTTKIALIGEDGSLLYSFYDNNNGSPVATAIRAMQEIQSVIPEGVKIVRSCSTGYGEALLKSAFNLDEGEVETIAHYTAAAFFDPEVDCILDIGGQDMKCIKIKDRTVDSVLLNEACSSGCGSFIETFAKSLDFSVRDFAREALFAEHPIDLGTRCTVFMNSKVKQAQKEGASVADISAGLAYSVIKNALFKVIKLNDASDLGSHVVVQGGTFYNNAVLRSFERIAGVLAVRPDIAGIMGAFGCALIARDNYEEGYQTSMLTLDEIMALTYDTKLVRCGRCLNNCLLTVNRFSGGRNYITGNRCERGLGGEKNKDHIPNLFEYKKEIMFSYKSIPEEGARAVLGIPRVLNMYENFPFWAKLLTELNFAFKLSPFSTRSIYELGIESIPSESECYPAKLVHGHIEWLIKEGVDAILYPCVPYERQEFPDAGNHYNCPIVTSYPENIKNNVDSITNHSQKFINPFINLGSERATARILSETFKREYGVPASETVPAVIKAFYEMHKVRRMMQKKGEETLRWMDINKRRGIVLAGRPYHCDPEVNHGIPELINSYGLAVLTEDSVSHLKKTERPLRVSDQWMYHSRLYSAAEFVKTRDDIDMIQLNSFGCGLDAVTTDQVSEILCDSGKIYTCLKIDEVNNLGAAKIRIRSLLSAIKLRERQQSDRKIKSSAWDRILFTKEMRKEYTILCPQMSPMHFDLVAPVFNAEGYKLVVYEESDRRYIDLGLKYVNNDACYPSLIVVGQIMETVLSGKYDTDRLAVIMSQTGGGCRATNYIAFIRKALKKAGYGHIPVISLNLGGLESNPGFKITIPFLRRAIYAVVFGDIFMRCVYATRPYEANPGETNRLHEKWQQRCIEFVSNKKVLSHRKFNKMCREIVHDFDSIPRIDVKKPRVGIVGEIFVKFAPAVNNHLVELLEAEGAEAVSLEFLDFFLYCFFNTRFRHDELGFSRRSMILGNLGIRFAEWLRRDAVKALEKSRHFRPPMTIDETAEGAKDVVSFGNQTGEGWFLVGEMIELIHSGVPNIVCCQPFGCLPNHIVGKGVIKKVRHTFPEANIVAIDFDPGASEVNQLNRIKLMLSAANKRLEQAQEQA